MAASSAGKASTQISTAIANPIRTGVQIVPAAAITEFIDAFFVNMNDRQYAALMVLLTLVISVCQNVYENYKGVGFLRNVPPRTTPVLDTTGDDQRHV